MSDHPADSDLKEAQEKPLVKKCLDSKAIYEKSLKLQPTTLNQVNNIVNWQNRGASLKSSHRSKPILALSNPYVQTLSSLDGTQSKRSPNQR